MNTARLSLLATALLALAACKPSEPIQPAQEEVSSANNAPTSEASVANASDVAASNTSTPMKISTHISSAQWQDYSCDENKSISAHYASSGENAEAQIQYNGQTIALKFDAEQSNDDLTAFSGNDLTWTIGNQFGDGHFYQESDGFLTQHEQVEISGDTEQVDNILLQNCMIKQ